MTKLSDLNEVTAPAPGDMVYIRRNSDTADPDKKADISIFYPAGARVTNVFTFDDTVTFPAILTTAVGLASFTVTGVTARDAVVLNPVSALPAGLAIISARVSADDTVTAQIYNFAGADYAGGNVQMTALITRAA